VPKRLLGTAFFYAFHNPAQGQNASHFMLLLGLFIGWSYKKIKFFFLSCRKQ